MAIQEVIKYEGDNSTLIYKHPAEDFNTLSQLIVHESQEAVFFSDGQALDSFKAGRYTLETKKHSTYFQNKKSGFGRSKSVPCGGLFY